MKIEGAGKIVGLVSGIVTVVIAIAGFILDSSIKTNESAIKEAAARSQESSNVLLAKAEANLKAAEAGVQAAETARKAAEEAAIKAAKMTTDLVNNQKMFEVGAVLNLELEAPLAGSFARSYKTYATSKAGPLDFIFPTTEYAREVGGNLDHWATGNGLMEVRACALSIRQVVTLKVKSYGFADAVDIVMAAWFKPSATGNPAVAWREKVGDKNLHFGDLLSDKSEPVGQGWKRLEIVIPNLHGTRSMAQLKAEARESIMMPLAVVTTENSGEIFWTAFYGSVFVPSEISWTDQVTKQHQKRLIMNPLVSTIMPALNGGAVGRLGSSCRQ
ncbi:hypothetical protein [Reyranella sp.]|uniref:hypothetical protein n=1 Tax=Reyranella sp. TaxID=1929291 RepID=UPI003D111ECD